MRGRQRTIIDLDFAGFDARLEIGGKRFAPDEFRIASSFDESRERFDVVLFHPQFKKSDEKLVRQVLFLTLALIAGAVVQMIQTIYQSRPYADPRPRSSTSIGQSSTTWEGSVDVTLSSASRLGNPGSW